jgi:hypothetical protein
VAKFPVDAPKARVLRSLETLGFRLVREREHIAMVRDNADGTRNPINLTESRTAKGFHLADYLHASWHPTRRIPKSVRPELSRLSQINAASNNGMHPTADTSAVMLR